MNQITYLLGAGASCKAMPLYKTLKERINSIAVELEAFSKQPAFRDIVPSTRGQASEKPYGDYLSELSTDLIWLNKMSENHLTVDTLAKKFFIRGEKLLLRKLKVALGAFFECEQLKKGVDKRYDSFFASLIQEGNLLPENISILSWNYDLQIEYAYSPYTFDQSFSNIQTTLRVESKFGKIVDSAGFKIIKLNGLAGFRVKGTDEVFNYARDMLFQELNEDFLKQLAISYSLSKSPASPLEPSISFAWETDLEKSSIVEAAYSATLDTNFLVSIGYSFPFFNREIDREIFGSMKNLEKVYFQAPDANVLETRFQAIRPDLMESELIYDEDQFFFPPEL